ncbi:Cof-type HAD-IIB family hydrolase [Gordonia bronchialis]|uniref:Cof-type HAD-IIB family hydrolase n=1 Tax=Gordonia bronchialis TaxID=2054 RepID=UPI001CC07FAD|nr:Cof-type HAD-IIB family hydrolase [Gordonia bronchialis]UAK39122.1 Cof-type HAD-IIB family hydrolase [Gordonia bronchialis]
MTQVVRIPPVPPGVRLIVSDMDGTLLDEAKRIPEGLWPVLDELDRRGVVFCPASGRQAATLLHQLGHAVPGLVVIAENGAVVARGTEKLSVTALDDDVVATVLDAARELESTASSDVGVVLCGPDVAFVERCDTPFLDQVRPYYYAHEVVEDLTAVPGPFVKVAIYDFGDVEDVTAPALTALPGAMEVVVSGRNWLDVMAPGVDKSVAVRAVQKSLGIGTGETMVFGDYLNDLAMIRDAEWSYAVANAHPEILAVARYLAPSNADNGVVRTIRAALGEPASR